MDVVHVMVVSPPFCSCELELNVGLCLLLLRMSAHRKQIEALFLTSELHPVHIDPVHQATTACPIGNRYEALFTMLIGSFFISLCCLVFLSKSEHDSALVFRVVIYADAN
jgi:hypothetical protein